MADNEEVRLASNANELTQATTSMFAQVPFRIGEGTQNDRDANISIGAMQAQAVAICSSASNSSAKVATVDNYPDFKLINGINVIVYMANKNTASSPTLNINGTGAIPLDCGCWQSQSFIIVKYVDVTVSGTRIQRYLVDLGSVQANLKIKGLLADANLAVGNYIGMAENETVSELFTTKTGATNNPTSDVPYSITTICTCIDAGGVFSLSQTATGLQTGKVYKRGALYDTADGSISWNAWQLQVDQATMNGALVEYRKIKTLTKTLTTSGNGNIRFEDLLINKVDVLNVYVTSSNSRVAIPYKNGASWWGVHVISDNANNSVASGEELNLLILYIDKA